MLCADCALLVHKDHYLTPFLDPSGAADATIPASVTARSPAATAVNVDELWRLIDACVEMGQVNLTVKPSTRTGASRPRLCVSCCKHLVISGLRNANYPCRLAATECNTIAIRQQ